METNKELFHYGVLGMKWGRRKVDSSLNDSEDRKKVNEILKKKPKEMTNDELRIVIDRLIKERQVKDMTKTKGSLGEKLVRAFGSAALKVGANYATSKLVTKYTNINIDDLVKRGISKEKIQEIQENARFKKDLLETLNRELFQQQKKKD